MSDIKVKAFGIASFTKPTYLVVQTIVFLVLIACYVTTLFYDFRLSQSLFLRYMREGSLIIFGLEIGELLYMLWKFKKAEEANVTI